MQRPSDALRRTGPTMLVCLKFSPEYLKSPKGASKLLCFAVEAWHAAYVLYMHIELVCNYVACEARLVLASPTWKPKQPKQMFVPI